MRLLTAAILVLLGVLFGGAGSEKRAKYSVVGSAVNFTGRMESYSVGGQVLISSSTFERVGDLVEVRGTMQVQMKGGPLPATLYDVRGIRGTAGHPPEGQERCSYRLECTFQGQGFPY